MTEKKITRRQQKANRKKWVAALKSGEYKHGTSFLRRGDCYCCMGVLAELAGCEVVAGSSIDPVPENALYTFDGSKIIAPERAMQFAGLLHEEGRFDGATPNHLTTINDCSSSFDTVISIIEAEPEGLFTS